MNTQPLRVGIGGPVGSGKTALTLALCLALRDRYNLAVVTNDIYTREDADFLVRNEALAPERIIGVDTGGCPHTALRGEASIYVAPAGQGRGLGRRLYAALLAELETRDMHLVLAAVALPNPASIALHRACGFEEIGTMREVGHKHDRWIDVTWLQRALGH